MQNRLLSRYSKLPTQEAPTELYPNYPNPTQIHAKDPADDASLRSIVRPVQFVFSSLPYCAGWGISVASVLCYFLILKLLLHPSTPLWGVVPGLLQQPTHLFVLWAIVYISQWGGHALQIIFKRQRWTSPNVFVTSSLGSQVAFLGVIDFCVTVLLFGGVLLIRLL